MDGFVRVVLGMVAGATAMFGLLLAAGFKYWSPEHREELAVSFGFTHEMTTGFGQLMFLALNTSGADAQNDVWASLAQVPELTWAGSGSVTDGAMLRVGERLISFAPSSLSPPFIDSSASGPWLLIAQYSAADGVIVSATLRSQRTCSDGGLASEEYCSGISDYAAVLRAEPFAALEICRGNSAGNRHAVHVLGGAYPIRPAALRFEHSSGSGGHWYDFELATGRGMSEIRDLAAKWCEGFSSVHQAPATRPAITPRSPCEDLIDPSPFRQSKGAGAPCRAQ